MHAWQFEAIGTAWQIDTARPLPEQAKADVRSRIERFDKAWSRFRGDSQVADMARRPGDWQMPEEADQLFGVFDLLHDATGGAVNPLIGGRLADLGYDANYSLSPEVDLAPVPSWDSVEWNEPVLTTIEPVVLDIGAAGKGLLVDFVSTIISEHTLQYTVDASGDIYHGGTVPMRVAMEHPHDPSRAIGVVNLDPEDALCASATNRRTWGDGLHHVLDARTGLPAGDVIATWVVVTQSCMWADGLATAYFFAGYEALSQCFEHEFVRMFADGRMEWSPNFPGELFV